MGEETRTSTKRFEYDHPVQQGTKKTQALHSPLKLTLNCVGELLGGNWDRADQLGEGPSVACQEICTSV